MKELLADPAPLKGAGPYLLLCASGKRSLATARELSERGIAVKSFAGGLSALPPEA
jgi:rhodanese-related sulfurtransferase